MKTNELSVGNLVRKPDGRTALIYLIRLDEHMGIEEVLLSSEKGITNDAEWLEVKELQPILITPEFLEKNGFKWNSIFFLRKLLIEDVKIEVESIGLEYAICIYFGAGQWSRVYIKYIHQLQNFLTLCGIELKIKM